MSSKTSYKLDDPDDKDLSESLREKLAKWSTGICMRFFVLIILVLHVILISCLIFMDQQFYNNSSNNSSNTQKKIRYVEDIDMPEHILHNINLALLLIYFLEVIIRSAALGTEICRDCILLFDSFIVMATAILYVVLTEVQVNRSITYASSYLILFRFATILKLYEAIKHNVLEDSKNLQSDFLKARNESDEKIKELENKVIHQKQRMQFLKDQINVLHQNPDQRDPSYFIEQSSMASDEELGQNMMQITPESIHADLSSRSNGQLANGSLQSHTPGGSNHSLTSNTQYSNDYNFDVVSSPDRLSKKMYPDLVEHTHSSKNDGNKSPPRTLLSQEIYSGTPGLYKKTEFVSSLNDLTQTQNGIDHMHSKDYYETAHSNPASPSQQLKPRGNNNNFLYLKKDDKKKLLKDNKNVLDESMKGAYVNDVFEDELKQEELLEIKRISQIPFASTSCLNTEVPTTDL